MLAWLGWEAFCDVGPGRIAALDQSDFLFTAPAFNFLLACDCVANVTEFFEVNQAEDFVACCESGDESLAMFDHAAFEIAGYTGV